MSNEELAVLIQNGDDGYLPTLWEQVRKIVCIQAERYHNRFVINGGGNPAVDVDDLIQCGYFAVLEAAKYYSPCKGFKFTTFLSKTLVNAFREALGIRTSRRDPCVSAFSLDVPYQDDEVPLVDLIGSPDLYMVLIEESVYNHELRHALDSVLLQLPEIEREALILRFFFGITYEEQARRKGVSHQSISQHGADGLDRIRRNQQQMRILAAFLPEYDFDPYRYSGFAAWKATGQSVQECYISGCDHHAAQFLI